MASAVTVKRKTKLKLKPLRGPFNIAVGFPRGKTKGLVISKAIWNEFGTRGGASGGGWGGPVPERPFFRNSLRNNRKKYRDILARQAKLIVEQQTTTSQVLNKLGIMAVGDVQNEIDKLMSPPNKPTTIKLKGSSKPLIDSGEMKQSVTYRVELF